MKDNAGRKREGYKRKRRRVDEKAGTGKSILGGWHIDLSRESRKLRIRCFSRNGRNQTLELPDGEREARRSS